jgi:hypothetical protein
MRRPDELELLLSLEILETGIGLFHFLIVIGSACTDLLLEFQKFLIRKVRSRCQRYISVFQINEIFCFSS